ncbi:hypothetical protein PMIN06_007223 [Paraphaeosphaeria minitans]
MRKDLLDTRRTTARHSQDYCWTLAGLLLDTRRTTVGHSQDYCFRAEDVHPEQLSSHAGCPRRIWIFEKSQDEDCTAHHGEVAAQKSLDEGSSQLQWLGIDTGEEDSLEFDMSLAVPGRQVGNDEVDTSPTGCIRP